MENLNNDELLATAERDMCDAEDELCAKGEISAASWMLIKKYLCASSLALTLRQINYLCGCDKPEEPR